MFEVNVVFMCHFAEAIRKAGIKALNDSPYTGDVNGRLVTELALGDRFVKILSFVVSTYGSIGNVADINAQSDRNKS
jgi:hypothetical protein